MKLSRGSRIFVLLWSETGALKSCHTVKGNAEHSARRNERRVAVTRGMLPLFSGEET